MSTGHALAPTAQHKPFVDHPWQQPFLRTGTAPKLTVTPHPRVPTSTSHHISYPTINLPTTAMALLPRVATRKTNCSIYSESKTNPGPSIPTSMIFLWTAGPRDSMGQPMGVGLEGMSTRKSMGPKYAGIMTVLFNLWLCSI